MQRRVIDLWWLATMTEKPARRWADRVNAWSSTHMT